MALVYNYNDDVAATAFIAGLGINYSFYKHLMKHDVTNMNILSRAEKYIELKEATMNTTNRAPSMKLRLHSRLKDITRGMTPTSW